MIIVNVFWISVTIMAILSIVPLYRRKKLTAAWYECHLWKINFRHLRHRNPKDSLSGRNSNWSPVCGSHSWWWYLFFISGVHYILKNLKNGPLQAGTSHGQNIFKVFVSYKYIFLLRPSRIPPSLGYIVAKCHFSKWALNKYYQK